MNSLDETPITDAEYLYALRKDLTTFVERSFTQLNPQVEIIPGSYIALICSKLEQCRTGTIKRLIINLPPRSLKSHAVSVAFVAWLLGHYPTLQIICASYGQDLADKHAKDCKTLMASSCYCNIFPQTILSLKQPIGEFMTSK